MNHHYTDNIPRAAVTGSLASVVTIFAAFALLAADLPEAVRSVLAVMELCGCAVQIVFGIWDARQVMYLSGAGVRYEARKAGNSQ